MSPANSPTNGIAELDVQAAYEAAQRVVSTHQRVAEFLRRGQTLAEIDLFVARTLADLKCKSCFLGYRVGRSPAFPSHACLSLNDCVVHGTAGYTRKPIAEGDVLKIDIGVTYKGWIGDAAWTYSIGQPTELVARLMACGKESLRRGVETLRPGNTYRAWAQAVQGHVERECGFHLVRGLGGHGYGKKLHAPPYVSNTMPDRTGDWTDVNTACEVGTLVAVEPMIAVGTGQTKQSRGEWPVMVADGSMSVHYEHDVLIAEDGPRVLTHGLEDLQDIITR
jgi:methionyl aminopeptidase